MKKLLMTICGIMMGLNVCAEPHQPKADVYLKITSGPHFGRNVTYNGVFSVTNTGEIAFTVVTGGLWINGTIRFYREGDEEYQRRETEILKSKEREREERRDVRQMYDWSIEKGAPTKTLQPGEGFSFECKNIIFVAPLHGSGDIFKAEIYLGHDTWVPVHIMPTLYSRIPVYDQGKLGNLFYSKEGTNQYLYVKMDDGEFKRVSEIKLGSKPRTDGEDGVAFELPDGTKKKLTSTEARQLETKN